MPRRYQEGDKLGPTLGWELAEVGIVNVPLEVNFTTGEIDRKYLTPEQSNTLDGVLATHDPTKEPLQRSGIDIDSIKTIADIKEVLKIILGQIDE